MVFKTAIGFIYKMLTFKKGSLAMLSFTFSGGATFYVNKLMVGVDIKNIMLPVLIFCSGTTFYFVCAMADFKTGLAVAKYESYIKYKDKNRPYINNDKLYKTLWKLLGIILLSLLLMLTTLIIEISGLGFFYSTSLTFQGAIWVLACGFEIHSIGDNHQKRFGYKPRLFKFIDNLTNAFERRIMDKVDKSFADLEKDAYDDQDNEVLPDETTTKKTE